MMMTVPHSRRLFRSCACCDQPIAFDASRRRLLRGAGAAGLAAAIPSFFESAKPALAQSTPAIQRNIIDVHHHVIPPFYLAENRDRIAGSRGGEITPAWLEWTPQDALAAMDKHGVSTAVISLSTPGVWFGDAQQARSTARRFNDYSAELARAHPGRFGLFAAVPLPDTEGSLAEIEYALDVLKADGIGLLTSYGDKWLGSADYQPIFEELNRRKAVVFVHPTTPNCCRTLMPGISTIVAEVPHDTTRTIMSLLFSGSLSRFKDIRLIFCHAGGTLPIVAHRLSQYGPRNVSDVAPEGVEFELKRLYYDIAVSGYKPAVAALTSIIPTSQILFGSDHPYRPLAETAESMSQLGLSLAQVQAISRENALKLLPRIKGR
jgi:predicted TIM-barrel fold metal-dependent hydrolase